jgi:hypothetical protein
VTLEEKAKRKAARLEKKRLEEIEVERLHEEFLARQRERRAPVDSSRRRYIAYDSWQSRRRDGEVNTGQGRYRNG